MPTESRTNSSVITTFPALWLNKTERALNCDIASIRGFKCVNTHGETPQTHTFHAPWHWLHANISSSTGAHHPLRTPVVPTQHPILERQQLPALTEEKTLSTSLRWIRFSRLVRRVWLKCSVQWNLRVVDGGHVATASSSLSPHSASTRRFLWSTTWQTTNTVSGVPLKPGKKSRSYLRTPTDKHDKTVIEKLVNGSSQESQRKLKLWDEGCRGQSWRVKHLSTGLHTLHLRVVIEVSVKLVWHERPPQPPS